MNIYVQYMIPYKTEGNNIVATSNVSLSVYYPNESCPVCSPAGPITVYNGTVIYMQCSSETGNPAVMLMISSPKYNNRYTWTTQTIDGYYRKFIIIDNGCY